MKNSTDPSLHRQIERRFIEHVERLLDDDRLRLDTTRGRRPITILQRRTTRTDKAEELHRLMGEMGRPDREFEAMMPKQEAVEVDLLQKRWWIFNDTVGRVRAICVAPQKQLVAGQAPAPMTKVQTERFLSALPPPLKKAPTTIVLLSTSGFAKDAQEVAQRDASRTVILLEPNDAGGFTVYGPPETTALNELFDPEAEEEKRARVREAIASSQLEMTGSGVASDRLAAKTQLSSQVVEAELRSYAKDNPGLVAKRLDGRLVLFREGSAAVTGSVATASLLPGGMNMPMIDKIRSLFARRGETEKKIAFLSERRAALGQQRDRAYEEIGHLETKDAELREQFKSAGPELIKRRITSQLLQLRKDIERRQQLLNVLNSQVNVVSTHLHNLELVQQGQTAKLPDSEEMASDAAAAEEMLATLQESSEMAASVGGVATMGMSEEEQALYEELTRETGAPATAVKEPSASTGIAGATQTPAGARIVPPINQNLRHQEDAQRTFAPGAAP
jgi:hypothetical protein